MYKGDERTRTIDIYVDGAFTTSWTSSGTTLDYEAIALGVTGESIELRGVLDDSEWLSIMEVSFIQDVFFNILYRFQAKIRRYIATRAPIQLPL